MLDYIPTIYLILINNINKNTYCLRTDCTLAKFVQAWMVTFLSKDVNKILGDECMKKMTKAMLMTALILGSLSIDTAVHAEELQEFTLDPMIVTASRMENYRCRTCS